MTQATCTDTELTITITYQIAYANIVGLQTLRSDNPNRYNDEPLERTRPNPTSRFQC